MKWLELATTGDYAVAVIVGWIICVAILLAAIIIHLFGETSGLLGNYLATYCKPNYCTP